MSSGGALSPLATGVLVGLATLVVALAALVPLVWPRVAAIVRRDLEAFFTSPVAYVTLLFYALFGGNSFHNSLTEMMQADEPSLVRAFLGVLSATLLVAPVLTMRLLAEERDRGTLELLLTTSTRPWEVIAGKYLAAMILYAALVAIPLVYYAGVVIIAAADVDHGQVLAGFIGMIAFGSVLMSIGLAVSAWSRNAMAAVVVTLAFFFGLLFIDSGGGRLADFVQHWVGVLSGQGVGSSIAESAGRWVGEGLAFLSFSGHISTFLDGRIDLGDLAYHSSITIFALVLAHRAIDLRRG